MGMDHVLNVNLRVN